MKTCAKCEKAVYPTEELKCLDKTWHSGCFRCGVCNMKLNMKNYKGYDKLPYCSAHCPKPKATSVTETPESARLAANTRQQSLLQYHSDFEQSKGKYTSVSDDPETLRILQNQKNVSQLVYHSDFEQSKGKKTSIADDPETLRVQKTQQNISQLKYHSDFEENKTKYTPVADDLDTLRAKRNQKNISQIKYHEDYEKSKGTKITVVDDPETLRAQKIQGVVSDLKYHDHHARSQMMEQNRALIDSGDNMPQNMGGRDLGHTDYQPAPEVAPPPPQVHQEVPKPSPYSARNQGQTTIYNAGGKGKVEPAHGRRVGSIADYDPMNENYGSITQQQPYRQQQQQHHQHQQHHQQQGYQSYNQRAPQQQQHHQPQQHQMAPPPQAQPQYHQPVRKEPDYHQPPPPAQPPQKKWGFFRGRQPATPRYRAMYDYQAADTDEVSFMEGDMIINCQQIDEGWMTGMVERTRHSGMLPANYVERV